MLDLAFLLRKRYFLNNGYFCKCCCVVVVVAVIAVEKATYFALRLNEPLHITDQSTCCFNIDGSSAVSSGLTRRRNFSPPATLKVPS